MWFDYICPPPRFDSHKLNAETTKEINEIALLESVKILKKITGVFLKKGQSRPLFCLFSSFSHYNFSNTNRKSVVGVLGIRTRGRRRVGADETMELWWPPRRLLLVWLRHLINTNKCSIEQLEFGTSCLDSKIWKKSPPMQKINCNFSNT